ncbi:MAG: hypothetical protein H8F28_15995, partial [Fibrella sp.]|nr:hypothetical protein [Armatimonadota bacterium]
YRGARADKRELNTWTGETDDTFSGKYSRWVRWGYSPAHRRGFLREQGVDPADLVVEEYTGIAEVDNKNQAFGRDEALWKAWLNGKRGRVIPLLKAARVATGKLPVFLEGQTEFWSRAADRFDTVRWYAPWKPNAEPPLIDLYRGGWDGALPVPDVITGTYLAVSGGQTLTPVSEILTRTKRGDTQGLTVIDWSHRTLAEVEAELGVRPSATP